MRSQSMTRTATQRRLVLTLGSALLGSAAVLTTLPGCEGGGLGGMFGSQTAMDMLAPALKDAANSYLNNLTTLTRSLKDIQGYQDVLKFAEKAEPVVKQISSSYQTLAATSGEDRKNLMAAFGPKINSTNSGFTSQVDRVKGNSAWGAMVGPVLDRVKLFR